MSCWAGTKNCTSRKTLVRFLHGQIQMGVLCVDLVILGLGVNFFFFVKVEFGVRGLPRRLHFSKNCYTIVKVNGMKWNDY